MKAIAINTYILMMFLSYVLPRAGTFSMEEKVNMIEFLSYMALNPNRVVNPSIANLPFLSSASGVNAPIFSMVKSNFSLLDLLPIHSFTTASMLQIVIQ